MKVQAYVNFGGRCDEAASPFGMLTDKFGVPWMVNVAAPKA